MRSPVNYLQKEQYIQIKARIYKVLISVVLKSVTLQMKIGNRNVMYNQVQ